MTPPSRPPHLPPPHQGGPGYGYGAPPGPAQNPWAYAPPPKPGIPASAWIAIGLAGLCVFAVGAVFIVVGAMGARSASSSPRTRGEATTDLPAPRRDIPVHDVSILDGCTRTDLRLLDSQIAAAIDVGAPTYNEGDFLGCYQVYDRAALGMETALSPACKGPARALATGRAKAQSMIAPSDKAWAMRDAFDGMIDVIDRAGTR